MKLLFDDTGDAFWTQWYGIWRWDKRMVTRPGTYAVITHNAELRAMQEARCAHPTCVVDDFGNLVKVEA
jgi:hypothetical protein